MAFGTTAFGVAVFYFGAGLTALFSVDCSRMLENASCAMPGIIAACGVLLAAAGSGGMLWRAASRRSPNSSPPSEKGASGHRAIELIRDRKGNLVRISPPILEPIAAMFVVLFVGSFLVGLSGGLKSFAWMFVRGAAGPFSPVVFSSGSLGGASISVLLVVIVSASLHQRFATRVTRAFTFAGMAMWPLLGWGLST
jgi:hypothetical protein